MVQTDLFGEFFAGREGDGDVAGLVVVVGSGCSPSGKVDLPDFMHQACATDEEADATHYHDDDVDCLEAS